jgi:hypothetical protein
MAPSRTPQSRRARRIRRTYLTLALTESDYAIGSPEHAAFRTRLATAQQAVEALDLIGWETRAEGYTGADEGDEEAEAPKATKATKGTAHTKRLAAGAIVKAKPTHADIPVTMATAGAR